jgi:predicted HicB family RNase H-like nuclease
MNKDNPFNKVATNMFNNNKKMDSNAKTKSDNYPVRRTNSILGNNINKKGEMITFSVRLEDKLVDRLTTAAQLKGVSINEIIKICSEYVMDMDGIVADEESIEAYRTKTRAGRKRV